MLAQESQTNKLPLDLAFICQTQRDPIFRTQGLHNFEVTQIESFQSQAFYDFCAQCDAVTFESEFWVPEAKTTFQTFFKPSLEAVSLLKNKFSQKELSKKLRIPIPAFKKVASLKDIPKTGKWVLKWAEQGYDGRGVLFYDSKKKSEASAFLEIAREKKTFCFAERVVKIKKELALTGIRYKDQKGKSHWTFFELIHTEQELGTLEWASGPVKSSKTQRQAETILQKMGDKLDYVGALTAEFFLDSNHKLSVNEWAPRVHNSAHATIEAAKVSQFSAHLLACAGIFRGPPRLFLKPFVMRNVLGPPQNSPTLVPMNLRKVFLHDYFKLESKPRRKMAHLTKLLPNQKTGTLALAKEELLEMERSLWK